MIETPTDDLRTGPAAPAAGKSDRSDEQLLAEYRKRGDRRAFAELVGRYERELFAYLKRFLGDPGLAEDVFQLTFLQVHLKRDQFQLGRRFRPWVYAIATNQAIDAQRRSRRHRIASLDRQNTTGKDDMARLMDLLVETEPGPVASVERDEQRAWVQSAIDNLPDLLRSAVYLVYFQGLKYREAAEVLGVPVGTVKSRLHAAILKLYEAWTQSHPPGAD